MSTLCEGGVSAVMVAATESRRVNLCRTQADRKCLFDDETVQGVSENDSGVVSEKTAWGTDQSVP